MPNWCINKLVLTDLDVSVVNEIVEKVKKAWDGPESTDPFDGLFNMFLPIPEDLKKTEKSYGSTETDDEKSKSDGLFDKYGSILQINAMFTILL